MLATVEEAFLTLTYGEIAAFVVSLPEPAKTSVPITYDLWIGPEERMETRTHVFAPDATFTVIQVPVRQVDYLVSTNQIAVQITSIDGDSSGPFDSASTTVLPLFMNPPLPQVSIGGGGQVIEGLSSTYVLMRSDAGGPLTVFYAVAPESTASASDYTGPIPAGAYTFSDGESIAYISMSAVDDTLMENGESLIVKLLPSPAYMIGTERATKTIHDGYHGQVNAGHTVEWEDEDSWKNAPNNIVLWDELPHRWIPEIPSGLGVEVTGIRWMKRQYGNPSFPWTEFANAVPGEPVIAWPGIGHWEVKFFAYYDLGVSFFDSSVYDWAGNNVFEVRFEKGYDGQKYNVKPNTDEIFPEIKDYTFAEHPDQEKAKVIVTLAIAIPPEKTGQVKLRSFDPDHTHTPTLVDYENEVNFDPNDVYRIEPPGSYVLYLPNDNRITGGGISEVGMLPELLTFLAGEQEKDTKLEITNAQPGNNYIVAALPKRPNEAQNIVDRVYFGSDGFTLKYEWDGERRGVPLTHRSELLTVWRTLWVELDSMPAPDEAADGPFNQPEPEYDPLPGDLPNIPIDLLAPNFQPANIEVQLIPDGPGIGRDIRDDTIFSHYVSEFLGGPAELALTMRDSGSFEQFWSIQIIDSFELSRATDFDGETLFVLGIAVPNTNTALIFYETLRDRSYYPGDPVSPATIDESRLIRRAALHESGHLMGALDGESEIDGVMNSQIAIFDQVDANAVFTIKHFAIFQAKAFPQGR